MVIINLTPFNAKSPISGARLLGHIHSQTAPVHFPSWLGVQHPSCLQPQRASHLRHGHQVSAGGLTIPPSGDSYWERQLIHVGDLTNNSYIHLTFQRY